MVIYLVLKYIRIMEGNRFGIKTYDCTFECDYTTDNSIIRNKYITIKDNTMIMIITRNIKDNLFGIRICKGYGRE